MFFEVRKGSRRKSRQVRIKVMKLGVQVTKGDVSMNNERKVSRD